MKSGQVKLGDISVVIAGSRNKHRAQLIYDNDAQLSSLYKWPPDNQLHPLTLLPQPAPAHQHWEICIHLRKTQVSGWYWENWKLGRDNSLLRHQHLLESVSKPCHFMLKSSQWRIFDLNHSSPAPAQLQLRYFHVNTADKCLFSKFWPRNNPSSRVRPQPAPLTHWPWVIQDSC